MANTPRPDPTLGSPAWATNTNYGAGPFPGQPNKVAPPGGNVSEGFDPQNGAPAEWLNFLLHLDGRYSAYLDGVIAQRGYWLYDEFYGPVNVSPNNNKWSVSGGDTVIATDDSANNGYGVLKVVTSTAGASPAIINSTPNIPVQSADFAFSTMIRNGTPTLNANRGVFLIGLFDFTLGNIPERACWRFDNTLNTWQAEYGATAVDSGFTLSTGYILLSIFRVSGQIYFFFNTTLIVGPVAFATSLVDDSPAIYQGTPSGATQQITFVDHFKLWVDR